MKLVSKRFLIILLTLLLFITALLLAACSRQIPEAEPDDLIILRYNDVNPEGNITTRTAQYFADRVKELSDGHIEVEVYASGVLGDELQSYQQVQMGALDLYRANGGSLTKVGNDKSAVLALPFLFRDRDHFWNVLRGEIGREILEDLQLSGTQMVGLFYIDEGPRNLFMVDKPVRNVEELQGVKIRAMISDILEDTFRAFGANPEQINYAELYNTLKTRAVDGADNPVTSYYSNKFYQVAPYYTRTQHMYPPGIVIISEITWNHLSETDKQILHEAAEQAMDFNRSEISRAEEEAYAMLRSAGVEIIEPEHLEEWKSAVAPVYEQYAKGMEKLIQRIQETE